MSLEDRYLRDQLENFRSQIKSVTWFTNLPLSNEIAQWSYRTNIDVVDVKWPEFWDAVIKKLPSPSDYDLTMGWLSLVIEAKNLLKQPKTRMANHIMDSDFFANIKDRDVKSAALANQVAMSGEDYSYYHCPTAWPDSDEEDTILSKDMIEVMTDNLLNEGEK